jgi:hypothetical protein
MSSFSDFVKDFPERCKDVLQLGQETAIENDREVTLLLMTAAAALVVPFERLNPDSIYEHPSNDAGRFPALTKSLSDLLKESFFGSRLWGSTVSSWRFGTQRNFSGDPEQWDQPKHMSNDKKVKSVLKTIRNAFAHGNIFTKGTPEKIEIIVFVSRIEDDAGNLVGYNDLRVAPNDFRSLLIKWVEFLNTQGIPQAMAAAEINEGSKQEAQ